MGLLIDWYGTRKASRDMRAQIAAEREEDRRERAVCALEKIAGAGAFVPCPGCDGHECDWIKGVCAYPGATSEKMAMTRDGR